MDHLSKSRKQNYEVGPRGSDLNQLGATQMNDSKDYGFDWIDNDTYDWDSSRREEFKMAKRETTKGWNAYGATLLDDDGRQIRDNVGRTVRENLGASRRVDLGTTGETRVEDTPDFFGRTNYGGRDQYSPEPTVSANDEPLPPVKERILYPSTEPYNYAVDDGFETADGKQRRWTSVAADKTLMRQWHDMFGRIRTKWSSNSGFDSRVSNMSYDQSSSDKQDDYNKWARLQRPVLIGVAVFIVLSVAVLVPVIILTGSKDNQTKEVLLQYEYEARISNRIYSEDMANSSSEAFTTVAEEFCDLMDANAENKTNEEFSYQGCVVTEITNGSLVIRYTLIVLSVTTPTADQVSNVVGIVISLDQQEIGDFTITLIESLSEAVVINEENNPVRKKVQFNTTCSVSKNERCVTKYSECIDNVCSCTVIRYYDNTTDECTLIDCGEVPSIDNGNVTENGSRYGSVPLITCKHGYELSDNATVNCSSHGSWGHLPSCEPVKCQEFITPNYSDVNTNTTGRVFEDRIEITCTEGYILNGNISSVDCQADRSWSMSPECIPRTCEQFQNPKHSKILPSKLQFVYNENINVECDEGYQLVGNETLSCLANGTWIEKPTCEPVNCELLPTLDFAIVPKNEKQYVYNETVTIVCKAGYKLDRNESVSCQANSSWTDLPSCTPIECNEFIQPENSDIELNKTGYRYSDLIEVTCQSGYTFIGKNNLSCNTDGTWPKIYCAKINCTEDFVRLEHSIVTEWNESTSTFEIGCEDGYEIVGEPSVTCLNNGTWSIAPTCNAKDCRHPSEIPNAAPIDINSTTFNSKFSVECNEGFNSSDLLTVTCQSDGTWSKFPTCNIISCGNVTVPEFATVTVKEGDTYGKNVKFECIEGYELIGNSEIKCQQNSSWTSYPVCQIKDCGEIKTISDGEVFNETGTTFGSVIYIKCNEGFDIVGKDVVTCLSSGRWEILPSCLKTDCGNYSPPEHTNVGPNNTLSCDIGYEIIQNDTVECIGGNWSDIEGCKPVKCNSFPIIDNANTSKTEEGPYVFGDTVEILCDDGFEITGSSEANCGANKTWENVPKCDRIICQDFSIPNNAVIGEQKTKNRVFEDEIFVNCSEGYSLKGNNSAICGANKEWLNIPKCDPIVCEELQIQNSLNQLNNVQYKYNENATIICISGYILEGVETLKCSENGTWIHKPTCIPKRCVPIEILNAELQPNKTDYMFNESITVICISGYMLNGNDSISCLENGTWINIPSCTPVSCEHLFVPNGTLEPDKLQFMYNESVSVKCKSGYTLEGEDTLNCFENGSWANIPICTPVLCDLLLIENANVSPEKTNYTYNENVTVQCMEGFQLEGNEVNRCNESGSWINAPLCIPVRCEQPNIQNAVIRPNKTEYTYKENVTVVCDFGYTLEGDEIVYCAANRTWANVSICIPVECKLFTLPENAFFSIKQEKYVYNDNITIECMDGYELEGDGTTKCQANSSWTVLPICKPITCEPIQLPDYAKTDTNFTVLNFEDEISVGCKSGFILIGFNNISCDANGTWPDVICVEVNCSTDNIFKPENSVMYMNETVSSFEIECIEGYQIVGNSSVTCLDGTWSQIPTCEIVNCGNYIPNNNTFVVSSNAETTYNSSQNITCVAGLEFTNDSARVITCGANGQWNGVPVCSITGEVSFTEDRYSLIEGADEAIVCDVKDYPGWQTVIVAKLNVMNSSSFTPIAQIYHENESVVETLDGNYTITASFKTDGVSLTVTFQKAECDDEGVYICAAIVGDPKEPIQMKQTRTNVSVSCSDGCGEFIPGADISFDLVQSNTTTPINTSVPVQCIVGLEFTNDSTTYLTCGADRQWVGQPECKIPGKILFTHTAYSFETGDTEMIICEVTNYSSWQKVLLAKQTNQTDEQASPIALVSNEDDSFPVVNVLDGSYNVNATTREDGVTVSMVFSPAACASEGIYLCAAVVGDEENPIDSVFTETRVTIMSESHSPDIKIPAMVYLGREAHVNCTGRIGKEPTGERKGYLLMMTNFGDNGSIALYNGSDSPSIEGCYYRDAISVPIPTESSGSYLWAKCIIRHFNGTELESEQRNISVQDSFVSFEKMSYLFNIGEKASFVCEVENILDFDRIEIMSGGRLVTALNTSDMAVEAADSRISILANETSILNSSAKVVVMFDLTECSDTPEDMVDDVEYACAVLSGSETVEGKTVVTFQRPPFVPELTLSHQIIEGQDTWADRTFQCEGEIGDPEGTIEVESDFDGEFSTFLAPSKGLNDTSFGFLVSSVTMKTQCGYNATLAFALKNISRDHMHLKNLRCVTIPSDKIVDGRLMYSEQKVIKVVPGDYCEGVTTLTYKPHPFYCNSAVACNDKSIGVNVCGMDECADTQDDTTYKCSICESVTDSCRAKGVQCYQTSKTAYKGDSITFTCNTQDFGKVAIISVNNGTIIDVDNEDGSIEVMKDVIVTVGQYHISLGFTNVSCEQEDEYVIKLNNETDVTLSLTVISDPDDPVISLPMVINANEETSINCSGKVGRDVEGKKKTAIHLEFSSPDFGAFEFGENTKDYVDKDCEIFEMVSFNVLPDVNWNNSHVRCVTLQESAVVTHSPYQQLILEVPELFCQPLTAKSEIGGSVTLTCNLKDVSVISNVIISKDGNELLNADNETVPFEGYNDGITLAIPSNAELNINFPNVTCEQEGVYQIGVNQGLSSQQTLRVISPAMEPSLNTSSVGRINELFEISCSGYIGRDEEGNAASSLYLEMKTGEESGFSVISNVTRESAVEDNCQYFETIHMTFFTDISWNNTSVRCVARNETDIITESSTKHIQVESPNTYFENTDLTGVVGESLILTCVVDQMEGLSDIKISKGADRTTIASFLSTPNSEVVVVIDEESGINGSAGVFKINLTLQCGDEGMYYCMPSGSGPTTEAVTTIHLQRKPGMPELKMSREVIENKYTLGDRLFYCEGDIGDPAGTIEIQSNFNGSFQTFLSPENGLRNNSIGWIVNDVTNSTSCQNFRIISFAFHNITMEMQSKALRCVIHPSKDTSVSLEDVFDEKPIYIIPDDYCVGESGYKPHPYFCHLQVYCGISNGKIEGVPEGCKEYECVNENTCVDCSTIGGCNITGPTTTTATTTPSPDSKYLDSEDLLTGVNGENAQVRCNLNNIDIDHSNLTDNPVSVEADNSLGLIFESSRDSLSELNTFVTSVGVEVSLGTNSVTLRFEPLQCKHVGKYTFRYAALETVSQIDITANVSTPTISREPENFYKNQQVSLRCTGDVGRPKGDLVLQVKTQKGDNWQEIPGVTKTEEGTSNCTTLVTLNYMFYVDETHDGNQYRCKSEGNEGGSLNSSIVVAEVIDSVVYFTEAGVTAEIGSDVELQCILGGFLANSHVVISRKTINKEENICTMKSLDTIECSPAHIGGNATLSESDRVVTINIDAAECDDEGTYFCASVNDTSFQTSINVSLTKSPAWKPTLSLPIRMVLGFLETFSSISCNADVGYPPGDLRLEYSRDNSTSYSTLDIGTAGAPVENKEGCSVNKSISYSSYTYTQSWNNTSVRCAVYGSTNASDAPLIVSDVQTISLIVNECPSEGIFYMNHPLNCHYLITCLHGSPIVGNDCRSNCPNILSNTTTPHCDGNCTMLALTTGCIDSLD